jgi:lysozyme
MKIPRHFSVVSSHSGLADGPSPASVNNPCICCKLMNINAGGLSIITASEGFVPTPYRCPAGVASIGFGSTILLDGSRVKMDSPKVTRDEGKALLRRHLDHVESDILRVVRVPLNSNEFSALCSFVYNLGISRLISSTLKMRLNRGERLNAANEFPKWRRANGRILRGLVIRRELERRLFLTPVTTGDRT